MRTAPNKVDLIGQRFNRLVVVAEAGRTPAKQTLWLCRCDCGGQATTGTTKLRSGHTKSCGCVKLEKFKIASAIGVAANKAKAYHPEAGRRFTRLTVIGPAANIGRQLASVCRCDCGTERAFENRTLKAGIATSCGCRRTDEFIQRNTIHGLSHVHKVRYRAWNAMIYRCHDDSSQSFKDYGARGITVCDRWRIGEGDLSGFECFLADMGDKPTPLHTLDRIDNDGNYEPDNCRWATRAEQANNRRLPRRRTEARGC